MKSKSLTIILLSALFLYDCQIDDESMEKGTVVYTNDSIHTIAVQTDRQHIADGQPLDFVIASGETYCTSAIGYDILPMFFSGVRCLVRFDNDMEIIHGKVFDGITIEHDICEYDSYECTLKTKKGIQYWTYIYTFTDEDYERAVAANAESEE